MKPSALLVHVTDVCKALDWYSRAFVDAKAIYYPEFDFTALQIDGFLLEIVQADEKVGSDKFGTVLYWQVANLTETLTWFESLGAKLYRGPMAIEDGLAMCQVEDPFGNLIGFRGPIA